MHMRAVERTIRRGLRTHHAAWVNHTENRCRRGNRLERRPILRAVRDLVDEGFVEPGRAYQAGGAMPGSISRVVGREENMTVIGDNVRLTSKGRAMIQ